MPSSRNRRLSRSKAWRRAAVLGGVAGDLVRDGVEGQRLARVEEHEHEVGDALQPVELRGASIAQSLRRRAARDGRRAPVRLAPPPRLAARLPGPASRLPVGDAARGLRGDDPARRSSSSAASSSSSPP